MINSEERLATRIIARLIGDPNARDLCAGDAEPKAGRARRERAQLARGGIEALRVIRCDRVDVSSRMPHRVYTDPQGRQWEVWSVQPEYAERRRATPAGGTAVPGKERRVRKTFRVPLGRTWATGWLVFETRGEKRRLAPVPPDWMQLSDAELDTLRQQATLTPPARRLIE